MRGPWRGLSASLLALSAAGCSGIPPEPYVVSDSASRVAAMRTQASELTAAFVEFEDGASGEVAVAWAPVGRPDLVEHVGSTTDDDAWSAIKVPIALAAAVDDVGDSAEQKAWTEQALTISDNAAAARLWRSLGSPDEASAKVEAILRRAGDTRTEVAKDEQSGGHRFGRTSWAVADAARFAAALPCEPSAETVLGPMGRVAKEQRWGLGSASPGARFKGGWGPSQHGYLLRQIGVLDKGAGQVAVALMVAPDDGEFENGATTATALATWLTQRLRPGDAGSCPAAQFARPTTPSPSSSNPQDQESHVATSK